MYIMTKLYAFWPI